MDTRTAVFILACLVFAGSAIAERHPRSGIIEAAYKTQVESHQSTNIIDLR
jgi:hypothetical protein